MDFADDRRQLLIPAGRAPAAARVTTVEWHAPIRDAVVLRYRGRPDTNRSRLTGRLYACGNGREAAGRRGRRPRHAADEAVQARVVSLVVRHLDLPSLDEESGRNSGPRPPPTQERGDTWLTARPGRASHAEHTRWNWWARPGRNAPATAGAGGGRQGHRPPFGENWRRRRVRAPPRDAREGTLRRHRCRRRRHCSWRRRTIQTPGIRRRRAVRRRGARRGHLGRLPVSGAASAAACACAGAGQLVRDADQRPARRSGPRSRFARAIAAARLSASQAAVALHPSISEILAWPVRCQPVCLGTVDVYRRTCCCWPSSVDDLRIPELIRDLEIIVEKLRSSRRGPIPAAARQIRSPRHFQRRRAQRDGAQRGDRSGRAAPVRGEAAVQYSQQPSLPAAAHLLCDRPRRSRAGRSRPTARSTSAGVEGSRALLELPRRVRVCREADDRRHDHDDLRRRRGAARGTQRATIPCSRPTTRRLFLQRNRQGDGRRSSISISRATREPRAQDADIDRLGTRRRARHDSRADVSEPDRGGHTCATSEAASS